MSSPTHASMWPSSICFASCASAFFGTAPVPSIAFTTSEIARAEFTSAETCVTWTPSICSVPSDLTFWSHELGFTSSSGALSVGGVPFSRPATIFFQADWGTA